MAAPADRAAVALLGAVLALSACAAPAATSTPSPTCAPPGAGGLLLHATGRGNGSTPELAVCGAFAVDFDWRCPSETSFAETAIIPRRGQRLAGPRGDGIAGMSVRRFHVTGPVSLQVTAEDRCTWTADFLTP